MKHEISKSWNISHLLTALILFLSLAFEGPWGMQAKAQSGGESPADGKDSLSRLAQLLSPGAPDSATATGPAYLQKLGSNLQDLVAASLTGTNLYQKASASGLELTPDQAVLVDAYVSGPLDQAASQLEALGMRVAATSTSPVEVVEGTLPVGSVLAAAQLASVNGLLGVIPTVFDTGSVPSEGDGSMNGPAARKLGVNGVTGSGVTVGVISDSMNCVGSGLAGSQKTGDLPAGVTVLADWSPCWWGQPHDEGRAMAEIIYDTAPGITQIYFATAGNGASSHAAAINNLVAHGVKVIADDAANMGEPFFQDGTVSQAVDNAHNAGVAYFASAGNFGRQSYEQPYRDSGDAMHSHNFDPGSGMATLQTIVDVPNGDCINAVLEWDDPWGVGKVTHDFNFYLRDPASPIIPLASGWDFNVITGVPRESVHWCNSTGSTVTVQDQIEKAAGTSTAYLKYIAWLNPGPTFTIGTFDTSSDAIAPDAASANGAMAVAAVRWDYPGLNSPEPWSSRGPSITRYFDKDGVRLGSPIVRLKPDVAGPDCVSTSNNFAGGQRFGYPGPFCGTSAAAPGVAGAAALVLSAYPALPPAGLYKVLSNAANTIDCTAPGNPDGDCGGGFVQADKAVAWELPATLSAPNGTISTSLPTFTWNAVSGATWYYLWVDGPSGNMIKTWYTAAQVGCPGGTGTCSITPSTNMTNATYTWWVRTYNPAGNGPWSGAMSFTVSVPLPPAATLISPNGTIGTSTPTYTWNAVSNATWYYVWVNGPSGNVFKQWFTAAQVGCPGGTGTCSLTPSTGLGNAAYTWWIQTWNGGGNGPWSTGMGFTVYVPPPNAATLVSPNGTISTPSTTYTWNAVSNSTWYYLWVNGPYGNVIKKWYTAAQAGCGGGTGTCAVAPTLNLPNGSITWWIQTWNPVGYGPWSSPMGFTVSNALGFDSEFNGDASGWQPHLGSWSIAQSQWYTAPITAFTWPSTSFAADFSDFQYEVRLWRNGCQWCSNSVYVRGTPNPLQLNLWNEGPGSWNSGYLFEYTASGWFSVWRIDPGGWVLLQDWTTSSAINQGAAWNTMRVAANGSSLYFYINGTLVWSGTDATYSSGRVGITAWTDGTAGEQLWADYARLDVGSYSAPAQQVSAAQQALNAAAMQSANPCMNAARSCDATTVKGSNATGGTGQPAPQTELVTPTPPELPQP